MGGVVETTARIQVGGGVDLLRLRFAGTGQLLLEGDQRRVLQALAPGQVDQLARGGELARLHQHVNVADPVAFFMRSVLHRLGEVRDRIRQPSFLEFQPAQAEMRARVAGLEFEHGAVQRPRLFQLPGFRFAQRGLHRFFCQCLDGLAGRWGRLIHQAKDGVGQERSRSTRFTPATRRRLRISCAMWTRSLTWIVKRSWVMLCSSSSSMPT